MADFVESEAEESEDEIINRKRKPLDDEEDEEEEDDGLFHKSKYIFLFSKVLKGLILKEIFSVGEKDKSKTPFL